MVTISMPGDKKKQAGPPPIDSQVQSISTLERRVKVLEQGHTNLRKVLQVTEENILVKNKHTSAEFKTLTEDINELRRDIQDIRDRFLLVVKELKAMARKEDVKVVERYVNMWDPLQFVTKNEVEALIEDAVATKLAEKMSSAAKKQGPTKK